MRDVLLFVHLVGVAGWIGGGIFAVYGLGRLAKAGGTANGKAMRLIIEKSGLYFTTMFLLVVGAGVALVMTQDQFGWGDTFIWVGIGAIIASGIWLGLYGGKSDRKLIEAVEEGHSDRLSILSSWRRTAWVDFGILLVAMWAMVVKLDF